MPKVVIQTGRTSSDIAGNGWLPHVDLPWEKLQKGTLHGAKTDAKHVMVAIRKPGT